MYMTVNVMYMHGSMTYMHYEPGHTHVCTYTLAQSCIHTHTYVCSCLLSHRLLTYYTQEQAHLNNTQT